MRWRTPQGDWLVEGRRFPIQLAMAANRVRLPDGTLTRQSCEFFLIDPGGCVREYFRGPLTSTVYAELYAFDVHVVIGAALHRCTWVEHWRDGDRLHDSLKLEGLRPAGAESPPFDAAAVMQAWLAGRAG